MKITRSYYLPALIALSVAALPACKTKKIVQPAPVTQQAPPPPAKPVEQPKPTPAPAETAPVPVEKPNYNFSNIQFEFNSGILKTNAYPILDKAAAEMKKDPSVKFVLNGHSSAEGTEEHNMSLSVERANSVKTYLVNTGVNADNLSVKGFGETKPLTSNTSEESRALNRRVEIQKQ